MLLAILILVGAVLALLVSRPPVLAQSTVCGQELAAYRSVASNSNAPFQATGDSCAGRGTYGLEYQCVEFVRRLYSQALGINTLASPWSMLNAVNFFDAAPALQLGAFPNGVSTTPPAPDDILVFEGPTTDSFGHVAVVTAVAPPSLQIIEQNWSVSGVATLNITQSAGQYAVVRPGSSYIVRGWLRTMSDNFDANTLNIGRWGLLSPPPTSTVTVTNTNQQLQVTMSPGIGGGGLISFCSLSGDFDVQVDYILLNWPANNNHSLRLGAFDLGGVGMNRFSSSSELYELGPGSTAHISTTDTSGQFRLVRASSTLSGFFRTSSGWTLLGSETVPVIPTRFNLDLGTNGPFAPGDMLIAFDNFKVNAGTIHCPGSL